MERFDQVHGKFLRELNLKSFARVEPRCHPMRQVLIESGTGVDLLGILKELAAERTAQHGE